MGWVDSPPILVPILVGVESDVHWGLTVKPIWLGDFDQMAVWDLAWGDSPHPLGPRRCEKRSGDGVQLDPVAWSNGRGRPLMWASKWWERVIAWESKCVACQNRSLLMLTGFIKPWLILIGGCLLLVGIQTTFGANTPLTMGRVYQSWVDITGVGAAKESGLIPNTPAPL